MIGQIKPVIVFLENNVFRFLNRKKLLEILNGGIDPPIIIFVNQKKVRFSTCFYSIIISY